MIQLQGKFDYDQRPVLAQLKFALRLQYASNDRIYCHVHDLVTTSHGLTRIHLSKNSEGAIN